VQPVEHRIAAATVVARDQHHHVAPGGMEVKLGVEQLDAQFGFGGIEVGFAGFGKRGEQVAHG
jgi:hypothetical protein